MLAIKYLMWKLFRREEGANMLEYGLLIVLIALVAAAGLSALGTNLSTFFQSMADSVGAKTAPSIP